MSKDTQISVTNQDNLKKSSSGNHLATIAQGEGMAAVPPQHDPLGHGQNGTNSDKSYPPLLTGGLIHPTYGLMSVVIDYLTISVCNDLGKLLQDITEFESQGVGGRGFKATEKRKSMGGWGWRKYDPQQESKAWGLDYESWEWSGESAQCPARYLSKQPIKNLRPSRVDIAFDISVHQGLMSDEFAEAVRSHAESKGLTLGISGQAGINTRYIGSPTSERRMRIYRKDLEDKPWAMMFGPTLRIELVLKGKQAVAWWKEYSKDNDEGKRIASAHIEHMTGVKLLAGDSELPEIVKPDGMDEAGKIYQFLKQYGPTLDAWNKAGIPIIELAESRADRMNRLGNYRMDKKVEQVTSAGSGMVTAMVKRLLRGN